MRSVFFFLALVALAGCANQQYAGINYGEAVLPNGEKIMIAGGKDETNVVFDLTRPDGTVVHYSAENADASTALKAIADSNRAVAEMLGGLVDRLLTSAVPAP